MSTPRVVGVIPARYGATRFPGKPLADLLGKPMVRWVIEGAARARTLSELIVATDDERIAAVARDAGARAVMTDPAIPSGTDRVYAVSREVPGDIFLNIQGDEPLIAAAAIDAVVAPLLAHPEVVLSTPVAPLLDAEDFANPNVVKVVLDRNGDALYFSRSPIPHFRNGSLAESTTGVYRHLGLYGFRREFLETFSRLPRTFLEISESLEQLRALENGYRIRAVVGDFRSIGVDTPEDLARVAALLRSELNAPKEVSS